MTFTFLWYDYETFGTRPHRDRPAQFAALRTDADLRIIEEPLVLYCRPPLDRLPSPEACLVTGITPQIALEKGIRQRDFAKAIFREFNRPGTCSVGYNSTSFDNELTRFLFWRNFLPSYEHEWKNGASRFDLINLSRATAALRPDGLKWPLNQEGKPSFRLEDLTKENQITHAKAHDALGDVYALIEWAKCIHSKEPKLFSWGLSLRKKNSVASFAPLLEKRIFLFTQAYFQAAHFATSAVVSVASHPTNTNSHIVFNLRQDPESLLHDSIESLRQRLFAKKEDLPEGQERLGLSELRTNAIPFVAPASYLRDDRIAERLSLDREAIRKHCDKLQKHPHLEKKMHALYDRKPQEKRPPEEDLYGAFVSRDDQAICRRIQNVSPDELNDLEMQFDDPRLGPMLFLHRAENFPETLSEDEMTRWKALRRMALHGAVDKVGSPLEIHRKKIHALKIDCAGEKEKLAILESLSDWSQKLEADAA